MTKILPSSFGFHKQNYQVKNGEIVYQQPYALDGVRFHNFIYDIPIENLTEICQKWFSNNLFMGEVRPIAPYMIVTFADYKSASSKVTPYDGYGIVPYREVIVSFFVMRLRKFLGRWWAQSFCAFVPYIFADNILPIVQGREVYGMPKSHANITMPDQMENSGNFSCSAMSLKHFNPNEIAAENKLIEITANHNVETSQSPIKIKGENGHEMYQHISDLLDIKHDGTTILPGIGIGLQLYKFLKNKQVPFINLKQFRNISNGKKANTKNVVQFPCQMTGFHGGGIHFNPYELEVFDNDMFPIKKDFGLKNTPLESKAAFWMDWDFNFLNGKKIF